MSAERFADDYEPRWDIDARDGHQGEMWVMSIVKALADDATEVKTDFKFAETGNIYIEHECLRRRKWVPSGIDTTETATWTYVIAETECCLTFSTHLLREVSRSFRDAGRVVTQPKGSHPTRGVIVKLSHLMARVRREEMDRRRAARRPNGSH